MLSLLSDNTKKSTNEEEEALPALVPVITEQTVNFIKAKEDFKKTLNYPWTLYRYYLLLGPNEKQTLELLELLLVVCDLNAKDTRNYLSCCRHFIFLLLSSILFTPVADVINKF